VIDWSKDLAAQHLPPSYSADAAFLVPLIGSP